MFCAFPKSESHRLYNETTKLCSDTMIKTSFFSVLVKMMVMTALYGSPVTPQLIMCYSL